MNTNNLKELRQLSEGLHTTLDELIYVVNHGVIGISPCKDAEFADEYFRKICADLYNVNHKFKHDDENFQDYINKLTKTLDNFIAIDNEPHLAKLRKAINDYDCWGKFTEAKSIVKLIKDKLC